uniref:Uncharacterized protein n=1 Tax=Arundo donax TaxID=35708 RepID=A0A0A9B8R4_ARUDO
MKCPESRVYALGQLLTENMVLHLVCFCREGGWKRNCLGFLPSPCVPLCNSMEAYRHCFASVQSERALDQLHHLRLAIMDHRCCILDEVC